MTTKNLYDLLGVSKNATSEQIRQAYLIRIKMLHPDRFDPKNQRAEWDLANEMLKELNHAYGVLRDATSRAKYDKTTLGSATNQPPPSQQSPPRPGPPSSPPPTVKLGRLKSGFARFHSLPRTVQQRLTERSTGANKIQFAIKLSDPNWKYALAILPLGWIWILFQGALGFRWSQGGTLLYLGLSGVVAVIQATSINWIFMWHSSPLRCWLFVTPLYIIKTHFDKIWYWPIWEISNIQATHNHKDGSYQYTSLNINFGKTKEEFQIQPQSTYDKLVDALRAFDQKFRSARSQQDWTYFYEQDDFREFDSELPSKRPSSSLARIVSIFSACFAIHAAAFVIASSINSNQTSRSEETYNRPSTTRPQQAKLPPFLEPELPLPPNGEVFTYTDRKAVAPFEIKSSYGGNYLVKLADAVTDEPVLTVFVRGGDTVNLEVPLGTYFVKYAAGDKWYGYTHLFGPTTGYSKADKVFNFHYSDNRISGYTITLYKVRNGNLRTGSISASEF